MVEMAPLASTGDYRMAFAGDTFNTAWYMRRLRPDWVVDYVTCVGDDTISTRMLDFMASAGIGTGRIRHSRDRTVGLYMISLENGERSFSYWRGQAAVRLLADDRDWLDRVLDGGDLIYFSGITLAIIGEAGRQVFLSALAQRRSLGARIAFDPNLRPRLWDNSATMCDAVMRAAALSDIVLPSQHDEARWFGDTAPDDTLHRYLANGASTVIVKNGGNRIVFADGAAQGEFTPTLVENVVDSTAAGDSFNAAILARLGHATNIDDVISEASQLAARVIQGRGALVELASVTGPQAGQSLGNPT
jgi:2-dehydro-3-deoxygluconokinase